ncbi:MAG: NAD(P)-binding protein [Betaproteobacteria bacterium]|nr:NAD(P)-binding protein [Betaproteobacteria bacterium]
MQFEYIIVGSGLTGAVIARTLCDVGKSVLVIDRRPHLAGNIHDYVHPSGIPIHSYGPHYFRTNSDELWAFVSRFTAFHRYEPRLKSLVDGEFENWPVAGDYIERKLGPEWAPEFSGEAANFEEASMKIMPRLVYKNSSGLHGEAVGRTGKQPVRSTREALRCARGQRPAAFAPQASGHSGAWIHGPGPVHAGGRSDTAECRLPARPGALRAREGTGLHRADR